MYICTMPDKLTPEQRHRCMASIRSKDTKPEVIVRKFLFAHGYRFRIHVKRLPGTPDIVLKKYRTCIFVNGCFWHGHEGCRYYVIPKSNIEYWKTKIERNRTRDVETQMKLASMGWHFINVWECQLKPNVRQQTLESLVNTLKYIYLQDQKLKPYEFPEEDYQMVAEEGEEYGE